MTRAAFFTEADRIKGFDLSGHTGYGTEGSDILCAAVTSAVRLCECTLNTVMGLNVAFSVDESSAAIFCRLPDGLSPADEELCQSILSGLMVFLIELREEYPGYIDIVES